MGLTILNSEVEVKKIMKDLLVLFVGVGVDGHRESIVWNFHGTRFSSELRLSPYPPFVDNPRRRNLPLALRKYLFLYILFNKALAAGCS